MACLEVSQKPVCKQEQGLTDTHWGQPFIISSNGLPFSLLGWLILIFHRFNHQNPEDILISLIYDIV